MDWRNGGVLYSRNSFRLRLKPLQGPLIGFGCGPCGGIISDRAYVYHTRALYRWPLQVPPEGPVKVPIKEMSKN